MRCAVMTRRCDHAYVVQTVRDLTGVHTPRRRGPVDLPADHLPVAVAARLALLWAAPQDHALLTGGAGRGSDATRAARRDLLDVAVARGPSLDLLAPVTLPVRCGKAVHRIRLETDDTVVVSAHPDLDVDSERVAVSLGAAPMGCLVVLDGAAATWPPQLTHHGPRSCDIDAGELLAFVRMTRGWLSRGFDLFSCALALELGVQHHQVRGHLELGLPVRAAVHWCGIAPDVAVRWDAVGFSRHDVDLWVEQGRTLDEAEEAAAVAGDGARLARWARIAGGVLSSGALADWAAFGVPVGVWGEAANRRLDARAVPAWLRAGFQPVEVLRYAHLRIPVEEASTWRDAGFTAYDATGFLGVGMTLQDAVALRDLPAKRVQSLWQERGSVPAVLAALPARS